MHIRRQVPSGKWEFWYVDRRMLSSRPCAWCCLFFQGLLLEGGSGRTPEIPDGRAGVLPLHLNDIDRGRFLL